MEADGKLRILGSHGEGFDASLGPKTIAAIVRDVRVASCSPGCIRIFATLTVLVGALGQWVDVLHPVKGLGFGRVHAAFGLVLLLTLLARVFQENRSEAGLESVDGHRFQRTLKRSVYLLLYVLALVKESLIMGCYLWRGGAITLGSLVIGRHVTDATVRMEMSDDFGIYLLFGVAAIALVPMAVALRSR